MALLKYQTGFRGINNQSCVLLSSANSTSNILEECGCRFVGSLSSSYSKSISSNKDNELQKKPANENKYHTKNTKDVSTDVIEKPKQSKWKPNLTYLSQIKMNFNVPFKIPNLNKLITDTSHKLINSGKSLVKQKNNQDLNNSNSSEGSREEKTNSIEDTLAKKRQSIVAYYDPSYVQEELEEHKPSHDPTHFSELQEVGISYGEFSHAPREKVTHIPTPPTNLAERKKRAKERRAEKIAKLSLESKTKSLVRGLKSAYSNMSRQSRLEQLCELLIDYPECTLAAAYEGVLPHLLTHADSPVKSIRELSNQALSQLGYVRPLKSPGVRILSIDGGGTRGLVALENLKALEKQTGKRIYQLFDYVCGVSTGALLASMICLYKLPLDHCEALYKHFSVKTFTRNRVVGTTKLVWKHGFYDTSVWENILKKEMGDIPFIEFSRDPDIPKMSVVSSLANPGKMVNYLFRTYNIPPRMTSQYTGDCKHLIWQVVRASSAAPGYFEPFTLDDQIHEDGGILTNNPTALAIHECRLLWPKETLHCVVSLGTGMYASDLAPSKLSLKRRISTIVDSATDTEAVHHTLQDLLPTNSYYRFNPYLSEEFFLDEIRTEKLEKMQHDARMYNRRRSYKIKMVADKLLESRKPRQQARDLVRKIKERIS